MWSPQLLLRFAIVSTAAAMAAHPATLRRLSARPLAVNRISGLNATCDHSGLNVTVRMERPFKGILFARDFSLECRAFGTQKNQISVSLPTSGCGVRLSSGPSNSLKGGDGMFYTVTVVVQQDKHLRQITDQEKTVHCYVDSSNFKVKSKSMEDAVKKEIFEEKKEQKRTGRMKEEGWSREEETEVTSTEVNDELEEALSAARAWMEIVPLQENGQPEGTLQVGEDALLMVKSTLPAGIGWRVIDCTAHDGLGDSSQKLLDEHGCPLDELLMPEPLKGPIRPIAMMRHQEAVSKFAAFKFPDRDRLHLSCGLQLCRGKCPKIDCETLNITEARSGRTFIAKGSDGEVLDRLEVFNSVEVLAPGIELDDTRPYSDSSDNAARLEKYLQSTVYITAPYVAILYILLCKYSDFKHASFFFLLHSYLALPIHNFLLRILRGTTVYIYKSGMETWFRSISIPLGRQDLLRIPNKMALAFCILGLIFLCAVIVAAFALYKARRTGVPMPYYTRSLFSSSSGSGSAYGSKLLLHESPCMGQSASVRGYGRIL